MLIEHERIERRKVAKQRLAELRNKGYRFIRTHDEGATWVAADSDGLEIEPLLVSEFVGNIQLEESRL